MSQVSSRHRRRGVGLYIAVGVVLALSIIVATTAAIPSVDDFDLDNPLWNGYSILGQRTGARYIEVASIGSLDPSSTVLLVVAPERGLGPGDLGLLREYVYRGGVLVLADEYGGINNITEALGLGTGVLGPLVVDPLYMYRVRELVVARLSWGGEVYLDYASVLETSAGDPRCIVATSPLSYIEKGGSRVYGPFCIGAVYVLGRGRVYVFSDSSLWINSMIDRGSNYLLLENITGGRSLYIVSGLRDPSLYTRTRSLVLGTLSLAIGSDLRYVFVAVAALTLYISRDYIERALYRGEGGVVETVCREVERVLERHPEWDRDLLMSIVRWVYGPETGCRKDRE